MARRFTTPAVLMRAAHLALVCTLGACFEVDTGDALPVANAGDDQSFPDDDRVSVTLDGSGSDDPDGEIVDYEWRYTGDPRGDDAPDPSGDAGMPDPLAALGFSPRPEFCPEVERQEWELVQERWCELQPDGEAEIRLELPTGVHRFTLWVTDDDGHVSADSVVVHVGDTPPFVPAAH